MTIYEKLLHDNKGWAARKVKKDPQYFERLVNIQKPDFLWIGCSDSRVPPNEITQTEPGEMFIHRNVANLVVNTDMNLLSVLQYAVEVLKIKHIIICGHYGCGGVKAALGNTHHGLIDNWLRNIKDVYRLHQEEIEKLEPSKRLDELIRLNVREQSFNLAKTSIVQQAWANGNDISIHGWVYDLHDGIIDPVCEIDGNTKWESTIYAFESLQGEFGKDGASH
jgi:carbonic anhydrase